MMKVWLILLLITLVGCKGKPGMVESINEKDGEKTYNVSNDNEEMNAAIQEAIRNYPLFERAMQQPDTTLTGFSVKMKFAYGDNGNEHMWVNDLHSIGGQLFGVLDSEPFKIKGIQVGDTLRVIRNDITDWMYLRNGKLQGGYTIKVIYKNLDEKEKKEFRESLPFEIE